MNNEMYSFALGRVARIDAPGSLTNKNAIHEQIEIKCFTAGTATLLVGAQTVCVKAGDVVVINPYEFHATVDTGEERGKYHIFMLPLDYFSGIPELDLQALFFREERKFHTHFTGNSQLHGILMKAAEELRQGQPYCELMVKSLLMEFFALLMRNGTVEASSPTQDKPSLRLYSVIEPALRCIKNEYSRTMTAEELAQLCNVSKPYFCRAFKSVTGKSAMEYLRDFRLRVASALLTNTESSIGEIASSCGFESPNYFSRCYKQHYGRTPRQGRAPANDTE